MALIVLCFREGWLPMLSARGFPIEALGGLRGRDPDSTTMRCERNLGTGCPKAVCTHHARYTCAARNVNLVAPKEQMCMFVIYVLQEFSKPVAPKNKHVQRCCAVREIRDGQPKALLCPILAVEQVARPRNYWCMVHA